MSAPSPATALVYVWCYPRDERPDYSGWHLAANSTGCQLLAEELTSLASQTATKSRVIALSVATAELLAVPNNRKYRAQAARSLRFVSATEAGTFAIENDGGALSIVVGSNYLDRLQEHILAIARGEGDISMSSGQPADRLWFWWMPSAPRQRTRRR